MSQLVIVPIVEGYGEVQAVPILIRRWLSLRNYDKYVKVDVQGPVRASGVGALKVEHEHDADLGIEHYVALANLRRPDIILIILDADEDCPVTLGSSLLARAKRLVPDDYPIAVVVANREYEAWFLAAFASASFRRSLEDSGFSLTRQSLPQNMNVEDVADCKRVIAEFIGVKKYEPTTHQAALTNFLPFTTAMTQRSRSFRKLLKELDSLLRQARRRKT